MIPMDCNQHNNLIGVVETHVLHALLKVRCRRKHMGQLKLTIGHGVDIEKLSSRNVRL